MREIGNEEREEGPLEDGRSAPRELFEGFGLVVEAAIVLAALA